MSTESLEIALKERREDYVHGVVKDFVLALLNQGFSLAEIVDGLANYAWTNTDCLDACFSLAKASLAASKVSEEQRCQN
jgi:hypothetical protein